MRIKRIEILESSAPPDEGRPRVTLQAGEMPAAVDRAEQLLVDRAESLQVFQRTGELVRVVNLDNPVETGALRCPAGTTQLVPLTVVALTELFDRLAEWQRLGKDGGSRRVDCPGRIAAAYLERVGQWALPELRGIISAPILRPDGSVLSALGYDPATGLFLTAGLSVNVIEQPTRADALAALEILREPFSEFPFVSAEVEAVFIAAVLTAVERRLLAAAPLFCFDAPTPRTGKSLLADSVALIATGRSAPAMALSGDREELRKAITSILREGHSIVKLDNIEHPLRSPDLARALTESEYADRLLGESRLLQLLTNITWTATGNNLAVRGDLAVRALVCRVDARIENPEGRRFRIPDLKAHLFEHRAELIGAALTILRAYHVAGRPEQSGERWGGFGEWCDKIRDPLIWLGLPDPCQTRKQIITSDPDREAAVEVLAAWFSSFAERSLRSSEVIQTADPDLRQAIAHVSASRDNPAEPDARRLGHWLRAWADRPVEGFCLRREWEGHAKTARWRVERFSDGREPSPQTPRKDAAGAGDAGSNSGQSGQEVEL